MKTVISAVLACCLFVSIAYAAGPFEAPDEEAQQVANFVGSIVGPVIEKQYPTADIKWGGRFMPSTPATIYLIYCEVIEPKKQSMYYYYEFSLTAVNDNPELIKKYGL